MGEHDHSKPSSGSKKTQAVMRQHGPWQVLDSHHPYKDPWVTVRRDEVIRPDGLKGSYCVVHVKPGVCIVALDDDQQVHLTEEFHYGVGRVTIEAVSGGVEPEEKNLDAAKRELAEELGIAAEQWIDLGTVDPFTANVVSPTQLFLAQKLAFGRPDTDGGEVIQHVVWPFREAFAAVMDGRISHAPSAITILKIHHYLLEKERH